MNAPAEPTPAGSRVALIALLALVVLSPWPFGSVHLRTTQAIALISLFTALGAITWDGWHSCLFLPPRPLLWLLLGLWTLAIFQLVPLSPAFHHWLSPGSAFVWHPSEPAAAAVLGPGPHPTSIHPDATRRWLALATGVTALALTAAPALRDRRMVFRGAIVIVAAGAAVAVFGLVGRVAFGDRLYGILAVPTVAPFGPFVSKNHFAGYVGMTALLAVGLAVGLADAARRRSGWLSWTDSPGATRVVAACGVAVVLLLAVPVSLSRGAVVSLMGGLVAFALLRFALRGSRPLTPRRATAAAAALGMALVAFVIVLPETARARMLTLTGITDEQSGAYRLNVWRDTCHLVAASPVVGFGLGVYEDALPRFKTGAGHLRVEHAENDYLESLAEGGAIGGLLLGALIALVVAVGLRATKDEPHRVPRALRSAAVAGFACLLVHEAFDFNLRIPSNALCSAGLVALLIAPVFQRTSQVPSARSRVRATALGAAVLATLLIALATPWEAETVRPLARVTRRPEAALRRSALDAQLADVLRRRPANGGDWVRLGWLRLAESRADAAALSRWGAGLDPQNQGLCRAAAQLQRQ